MTETQVVPLQSVRTRLQRVVAEVEVPAGETGLVHVPAPHFPSFVRRFCVLGDDELCLDQERWTVLSWKHGWAEQTAFEAPQTVSPVQVPRSLRLEDMVYPTVPVTLEVRNDRKKAARFHCQVDYIAALDGEYGKVGWGQVENATSEKLRVPSKFRVDAFWRVDQKRLILEDPVSPHWIASVTPGWPLSIYPEYHAEVAKFAAFGVASEIADLAKVGSHCVQINPGVPIVLTGFTKQISGSLEVRHYDRPVDLRFLEEERPVIYGARGLDVAWVRGGREVGFFTFEYATEEDRRKYMKRLRLRGGSRVVTLKTSLEA